jgi:cardiolipin synthase
MERFDVTYWGKLATFLLMFAIPGFMLGDADSGSFGQRGFLIASWILVIPGLALSYWTAIQYVPKIRAGIAAGRAKHGAALLDPDPHRQPAAGNSRGPTGGAR